MVGNVREVAEHSGYLWKLIDFSDPFPPPNTHTYIGFEKGMAFNIPPLQFSLSFELIYFIVHISIYLLTILPIFCSPYLLLRLPLG